jgi:hypothetical protein
LVSAHNDFGFHPFELPEMDSNQRYLAKPVIRPSEMPIRHRGDEAADAVADDRGLERRGQCPFIACQCASASCAFEIAGSIISPCFPALAVSSMTYSLGSRK